MLLIASLPMFNGPRWLKMTFARVARSTKKVPSWHHSEIKGTNILLGTVPRADKELRELYKHGVRAVVSLNQLWEPQCPGGVAAACARTGLAHLSLPTPDYSSPSQRDIRRAVDFIDEHVKRGENVYVHCNAGRGRSAVCVLAYMMRARGLTALQAYTEVAAYRRITPLPTRLCGLPRPQWKALLRYQKALARESKIEASSKPPGKAAVPAEEAAPAAADDAHPESAEQ